MLWSAALLSVILVSWHCGRDGDSIVGRIGRRLSIFWRVCSTAAKLRSCLARAVADRKGEWKEMHRLVTTVDLSAISSDSRG